jgi:hypothetical protein
MCNFTIEDFERNKNLIDDRNTGMDYRVLVCASCRKPIGDHNRAPPEPLFEIQGFIVKRSDIVYAMTGLDGMLQVKHKNGDLLTKYYSNTTEANEQLRILLA